MKWKFSKFLLIELLFLVIIVIFSIKPVENYDFWFHAKYGEYIFKTHSLPFTDIFSHTAFGLPAIPYEWLFQITIYIVFQTFGTVGVQILVFTCMLVYLLIFRQILKEIFNLYFISRMFFLGLLSLLSYDFWVERPQVVAYVLFMAILYLVLKRVFLGKNWLWLSIPMFFVWTNLHASMILGLYLFFSFGLMVFILSHSGKRSDNDKTLLIDLLLFGAINAVITILPPLGIKVYQLLLIFFEKREFITRVIDEWTPLAKATAQFYVYIAIILVIGVSYAFAFFKNSRKKSLVLLIPLIPLGLFVISGIRQIPFATPAIFVLAIPALQMLKLPHKLILRIITVLSLLLLFSFGFYYYKNDSVSIDRFYPKQAIPFIKNNLSGNMFNEYSIGGYLMYQLGPKQKTFIDGRTDMFLPVVLPEYDKAFNHKYTEDKEFMRYFQRLVDKYHISWALLSTNRYTPWRRLARILSENKSWRMVFFDDTTEIYVRDDGKNNQTLKTFGIFAATPFGKRVYKQDKREKARTEYEEMQIISKSAVATNALGFMLLEDGKFTEAKKKFEKALQINPYVAAPKMNLAELAAKDSNFQEAIALYRQAISDDPERGLAYLRLGQLIIQSGGSKEEAIAIWQEGLTATPDQEVLQKIRTKLNSTQ